MRALFFLLLRRLTSGLAFNRFVRDSHRKSGVLSCLALLSPVDSCNPPELQELTVSLVRPRVARRKRKEHKNAGRSISRILSGLTCGFLRPLLGFRDSWHSSHPPSNADVFPRSKKKDRPIDRAVPEIDIEENYLIKRVSRS